MLTAVWSVVSSLLGNKYVLIALLVLSTLGYIHYLRSSNDSLRTEKAALEVSNKTQQETINNLHEDIESVRKSIVALDTEKKSIEKQKKELDETLYREKNKKKSLEELAIKKTSLIEKLVNKATKAVFDCFELLSKGGDC